MKNSSKGFTLVELVIIMFIIGVVFQWVAGVVGFSSKFITEEDSQISAQENLRRLNVMVEKDVRKLVLTLPNDFIDLGTTSNQHCFQVGTTTTAVYCHGLVNHRVTRNGNLVSENIDTFSLTSDMNSVRFQIQTLPDRRNAVNNVDIRVVIRTGEAG